MKMPVTHITQNCVLAGLLTSGLQMTQVIDEGKIGIEIEEAEMYLHKFEL